MKIHVRIRNKTFEVRLGDLHSRPIQAQVDGDVFEVWPEEMMVTSSSAPLITSTVPPQPVVEAPASAQEAKKSKFVQAPLPGVIIEINAKVGDQVKFGDALCVLEAMKMKNSIRANCEGVISEVLVANGDQVKHGQILIRYKK